MDLAAAQLRLFLPESELRVTPPDPARTTQHSRQRLWDGAANELAGLIRALGVSADRVDDLLQELYLKTVENLPASLGDDEARRWLFRVATNRCRLEHRRRSRWQRLLERFATWSGTPQTTAAVEDRERTAEIDAALDRLSPAEREIVVLRYFCNLNSREIGEVLDIPESTIRSHLAKARRQLARDLADWNDVLE